MKQVVEETLFLYCTPKANPDYHKGLISVSGRLNLHIVAVEGTDAAEVVMKYIETKHLAMVQVFGQFTFIQVVDILKGIDDDCYVGAAFPQKFSDTSNDSVLIAIVEGANPDKHQVTITLPQGDLDCFLVSSYNQGAKLAQQYAVNGVDNILLCGGFGFEGASKVKALVPEADVAAVFFPYHPLFNFKRPETHFS